MRKAPSCRERSSDFCQKPQDIDKMNHTHKQSQVGRRNRDCGGQTGCLGLAAQETGGMPASDALPGLAAVRMRGICTTKLTQPDLNSG